jgi:glucokinase-like ROK family protein
VAQAGSGSISGRELDELVTLLDLVRSRVALTKPELVRHSRLGRNVVSQRLAELTSRGLLTEGELRRSTGGRAARELALRADAGVILVAFFGATGFVVALTDLAGRLLDTRAEDCDIAIGPEPALERIEEIFDEVLASDAVPASAPLYGIGVGLPGPVELTSGRPFNPPIMPGWDGYPVRDRLAGRYEVPVWVDNEVNLMALGELHYGQARGERSVICVKIGTGIGAGLISDGQLHRGAHGCAGDIGHVAVTEATGVMCRCGNLGCLEALAGGAALARDGAAAAEEGRSHQLAKLLDAGKTITAADVGRAAQDGDHAAVELMTRSGRLVGETLATLVNFFDPSLMIVGGAVAERNNLVLAAVRGTVYRRSLPLATRDLRIELSTLGRDAGLLGAARMVIEGLFSRDVLGLWMTDGSPAGRPELAEVSTALSA